MKFDASFLGMFSYKELEQILEQNKDIYKRIIGKGEIYNISKYELIKEKLNKD